MKTSSGKATAVFGEFFWLTGQRHVKVGQITAFFQIPPKSLFCCEELQGHFILLILKLQKQSNFMEQERIYFFQQ